MREVAIVAVGQSKYGNLVDRGIKEMFNDAYQEMLCNTDKEIKPQEIEAAYVGTLGTGGFQLGISGAMLANYVGLPHTLPVTRVENACASGGFALLDAVTAVSSGEYDLVLAGGVEKMQDLSGDRVRYWLGVSGDTEYERLTGMTFAGVYALIAARYMHDYIIDKEILSKVAVKNHSNGAKNPKAHFQREVSLDRAVNGPNVAYPLNLYDCCPISDGAATALITTANKAERYTSKPIYITGFGAGSDYLAIQDREPITSLAAAKSAAKKAYRMANRVPEDIDLAEVHDCFTIAELIAYEDLGFCERGNASELIENGITKLEGDLPVNPSGGLKAKGHPLGATGIGQAYEVFKQLRKEAGERQVPDPQVALTHNVGGSGGAAVVFIYER